MIDLDAWLAELKRNGEGIVELVRGTAAAQARWRPDPDSWSLLEVVNHLVDEEREDFRQRIDYVLHRPGEPWPGIDPDGWVLARAYNERDLAESLANFQRERARSLAWLDSLRGADWAAAEEHPVFGRFTAGDLFMSWVTHDHLHLRQIAELKRAYLESRAEGYRYGYAGDW